MYRPIHEDFIEAWRMSRTWRPLYDAYVGPNEDFLRLFYRNFVGVGGGDGAPGDNARMRDEYRTYWVERPAECDKLLERLEGVDIRKTVESAVERLRTGLRARTDVDVVSLIGFGTTNACQLVHDGTPTVVLALDVWGTTFMNEPLPWADIPLWLSHEYAHVIRYTEGESGFSPFIVDGSLDYAAAIDNVPFIEFLIDEGLATAVAQRFGASPHAKPESPLTHDGQTADGEQTLAPAPPVNTARALGFNDEQLAWCRAHEGDLWREIRPKLHRPLTVDGYARYFSYGASDIVARSAYFLGFTIVDRFLRETGIDLAAALRLPAAEFVRVMSQ